MTHDAAKSSGLVHKLQLLYPILILIALSQLIAWFGLHLWGRDLIVPQTYMGTDDVWQLGLTKTLLDTGWISKSAAMGAPGVAHFYNNSAAATSALHSVLMRALSVFFRYPAQLQQIYFILNFSLISITSYIACRLLKIAVLPAMAVGLLMAFTPYRFSFSFYVFLANYFMVPLALVSVYWILAGRFNVFFSAADGRHRLLAPICCMARVRDFWLGLSFVALMAACDGYYTFFTLLLLAFAGFARLLQGDWRRPLQFLPICSYLATLACVALALQIPLNQFKKTHLSEFYPNGVADPAMFKAPFEAEVYATSLKMLVAPHSNHSIAAFGRLGKMMADTTDAAFTIKLGGDLSPLATLGSLLLFGAFILIGIPSTRRALERRVMAGRHALAPSPGHTATLLENSLSLSLIIFLCSIRGGIGTLIALIYPTIRAYDRFPIFLMFTLTVGAAWLLTQKLQAASRRSQLIYSAMIIMVTGLALFDEIPKNAYAGSDAIAAKFNAEARFVAKIEAAMPYDAMVFQYPYSQYLRNDPYYGWGSFAGQRLYLHSHHVHWSNGGGKYSPADNWDFVFAQLPPAQLITELTAAGFDGMVIDRTVVKPAEYALFHQALIADGDIISDDPASKLAFANLRDHGYRLIYNAAFTQPDALKITDPTALRANTNFSMFVDGEALIQFAKDHSLHSNEILFRATQPGLFTKATMTEITGGHGDNKIEPISKLQGAMRCTTSPSSNSITLTLHNLSPFPIWFNTDQPYHLSIGVHIYNQDGTIASWDPLYRAPITGFIGPDQSQSFKIDRNTIPRAGIKPQDPQIVEFGVLQEGYRWSAIGCKLPL